MIGHQLASGQNLAGKFDFARPQSTTSTRVTAPSQEETDQLPHRIETETAWHHGIAGEMAVKEPKVGVDIELSPNLAFAVLAAITGYFGNAIQHQHIVDGQLCVTGAKQVSHAAGD